MARKETSRQAPEEVDAYLAKLPDDARTSLERVRNIIRETAPEATERVSYGIPIFRMRKDLVAVSAHKDHNSLHVMSFPLMEAMAEDLQGFTVSGATIQFTAESPLPKELIERVVRWRLEEDASS